MLSKTFTLLCYFKKPKNYVNCKMPIYMRFTVDRKRIEIATKREIVSLINGMCCQEER